MKSSQSQSQLLVVNSLLQWFIPLIPLTIWGLDRWQMLDIKWFLLINGQASQLPDLLWTSLSLLGNGWALVALTLPLLLFGPRLFMAGLFSGLLAGVISRIAKIIASSPRPAGVLDISTFHIIERPLLHSSMPSGHTMTAFAISTALYFSIRKGQRKKYLWLFLLAIGTGVSRMAVGAHWPEDVLVGSALGYLCGLSAANLATRVPMKYLQLNQWPAALIAFFSLVTAYILLTQTLDFKLNQSTQYALVGLILITWLMGLVRLRKNSINV